jgi:hypothetical protein
VGRDSTVGIATCYGLDGPGIESQWRARFSAPVRTGPGAHPASCTMGTGSFPGVRRPGREVYHPPPSSAEVKERVELCLFSLSGSLFPVLGWYLPLSSPTLTFHWCWGLHSNSSWGWGGDRGVLKINYLKMHGTEADIEWLMLSTQLCAPFVCISNCMFWVWELSSD